MRKGRFDGAVIISYRFIETRFTTSYDQILLVVGERGRKRTQCLRSYYAGNALSLEGPSLCYLLLPTLCGSAPGRPKSHTIRLSGPYRLLAPRLFCLFDGVPLRVSTRYS
jgi:hypothetical protein